ncbi:hypothetical protein RQP54_06365 [Curvibacter sp. APW13]|uniref:hypothetical protein n=1 Tax=Curvibacter sp. APW13 TaxID=3077236 RepID=UPI0028DF5476|nr:hypothetical protein [Curvibacter sp. APW13]MDT8990487.1 hypothetical protein [Curvibacter sp. APW13]
MAALSLGVFCTAAAHAQSYVNVSVGGVFSPGVYGQVTFGNAPPPPVYNPRPVVIAPVVVGAPVVYMHVPEKHRQRWSHYCDRYNACGYPVQFVQVNVGYRWWDGRGDYRYGDRYDDHDDDHGRHDKGRHLGHGKHHDDD